MDLRLLRESTRPEHEATEALMPLTGPDLGPELYVRVLQTMLPLVCGWERWVAGAAPAHIRPLLADRRRGHLLEADLEAMGAAGGGAAGDAVKWDEVVGVPAGGARDTESYAAAFLGCLYVMEGSTLGGRYIARHVEEVLHLEPGRGDAYFQGHGDQTGAMWREITAEIAAIPEAESETVIAAARRTFRAFGEALSAGLESRRVHG